MNPLLSTEPSFANSGIEANQIGLEFSPQRPALVNITCHVSPGEFVSILGPSGCGKSSFLRAVAGLHAVTQGSLTVAGLPPEQARRRAVRLAFVFQDPTLLPWRTVRENVRLPLELTQVPSAEHSGRIETSLDLVGIHSDDRQKRPRKLSGGMRMRTSLARALVTRPNLLLLDEPFAALDDVLRQQLNEELSRIWENSRFTALFVTHNVQEAVFLSQRVFVMTRSPGTILKEYAIPFPFPREPELRANPEFARLCGELGASLRKASQ